LFLMRRLGHVQMCKRRRASWAGAGFVLAGGQVRFSQTPKTTFEIAMCLQQDCSSVPYRLLRKRVSTRQVGEYVILVRVVAVNEWHGFNISHKHLHSLCFASLHLISLSRKHAPRKQAIRCCDAQSESPPKQFTVCLAYVVLSSPSTVG